MSAAVFVETLRRHVTHAVFIALVVIVAAIAALIGAFGGPPGFWIGMVTLSGLVIGCQLIGPEFSSGTLQLVLAKPVNRSWYVVSRFAGVVAAIWIFFAVTAVADIGARSLHYGSFDPTMFALPFNEAFSFLIVCALFAFFGSFTRSYVNVALYFLLQVAVYAAGGIVRRLEMSDTAISPFVREHPAIRNFLIATTTNLFPSAAETFDWRWMLMVASNAAVVLLLACLVFRNREVPYGAD